MRSEPVLAAVVLGAAVLASGCGHPQAGTAGGPPRSAPAPSTPPPSPVPAAPGAAACGSVARPVSLITVTYADNGRTLCVRRGTAVRVYLQGTPANRWSPIHASGGALAPRADGRLTLRLGATGASFVAARPGTATVRSFRQPCGPQATPGNQAAPSGTLECGAIVAFHATVKVP